jgi:hypothetical protein
MGDEQCAYYTHNPGVKCEATRHAKQDITKENGEIINIRRSEANPVTGHGGCKICRILHGLDNQLINGYEALNRMRRPSLIPQKQFLIRTE